MSIKVVCIDDTPGKDYAPQFKVGDILHISQPPPHLVIEMILCGFPLDKIESAVIVDEYPKYQDEWSLWDKNRFAQVSDIDETQMERNYSRVDQSLYITH